MKHDVEDSPLPELGRLPLSVEPSRDLWPDIAARLAPRQTVVEAAPRRKPWLRWSGAMAAGIATAVVATHLLRPSTPMVGEVPVAPTAIASTADAPVQDPTPISDAPQRYSTLREEVTRLAALNAAEHGDRNALRRVTYARGKGPFAPSATETMQDSLRTVLDAENEVRAALAEDPQCPDLQAQLRRLQQSRKQLQARIHRLR